MDQSERAEEFEFLIGLANADITHEQSQSLLERFAERLLQHPAAHPENRKGIAEQMPNSMDMLQRHLRSRLAAIINKNLQLVEMPLWQVSGKIQFTVQASVSRFHERFQLRKVKPGNEINVLRKIIDLWLMEIIRELDLKPKRIGRCPRCGMYFCSPTNMGRKFCSTRCGNAARQQEFRERRSEN
jgi:hypothetical protein